MDDKKWNTISEAVVFDGSPWIRVISEKIQLGNSVIDNYYRVIMNDFVCVFAFDEHEKVLCFRQYRHGPKRHCLTFPGGHLEDGEEPLEAARRELLEETGFEAREMEFLGGYVIDSNNYCSTANLVRAKGCKKVAEPNGPDIEGGELLLMPVDELWSEARRGSFAVLNQIGLLAIATHPMMKPLD